MAEPYEPRQNRAKGIRFVLLLAGTVVLAAVCALVYESCSNPKEDFSVQVVFKSNANYLIYFIAREKGFLADAGLKVRETEMESTNLMIQALSGGKADFNPAASVPALYSAEQNAPGTFKFLYVTLSEKGRTNDAFIVKKDSTFKSLKDLKGQRVATPPGASSIIIMKLIFADIGIDTGRDIVIQELEPRDQLQALAAGQADAVFAFEPLITLGEEKGISRILEAESMENHIINPIPIAGGVITERFAQSHAETVRRLHQALERSIDFIREHENESRSILARVIEMPEGTAKRLGINTYWKNSEANKDFVQKLADLFLQNGALQKPVDTRTMYIGPSK